MELSCLFYAQILAPIHHCARLAGKGASHIRIEPDVEKPLSYRRAAGRARCRRSGRVGRKFVGAGGRADGCAGASRERFVLQRIDDLPRLMANNAINSNPTILLKLLHRGLSFRAEATVDTASIIGETTIRF
jgi:hypothetical protein